MPLRLQEPHQDPAEVYPKALLVSGPPATYTVNSNKKSSHI